MDTETLARIDAVLDGARCWGAELDLTYRVLGVTVEPVAGGHPDGEVEDGLLQLVLHPCSDVQARLVHDGVTVERFEVDQLVAVIDRLDGAALQAPVVSSTAPRFAGPLSLEGRANVPDGHRHVALFTLQGEDRRLELRLTFDEAELRRPDGSTILPEHPSSPLGSLLD